MHSRRMLKQYSEIADAKQLLRLAAVQTLADAQQEETQREKVAKDAQTAVHAAFEDWSSCLSGRSIDLHQLTGLADRLDARAAALRQAELLHSRARHLSDMKRQAYALSEARADQAQDLAIRVKKAIARKDEDKALSAVEDRTAYDWSRS